MYPPPYPYPYQYPPFAVAPPPPSTPKGIGWCVRALMIYPVALVLGAVAGILAFALLGGLQASQDPFQTFALLLPVIALGIAGGVITLVVLILYLVGFGYIYKGRNELGPAHARNVRIAFYLLILVIVLAATSGATTAYLSFLAFRFDFTTGTTTFDPGMLYAAQVVSIAFGIAVAASVAAHLVLTIRALAKPDHERFLYAAAAIGTTTPGVSGAILLLVLPGYINLITATTPPSVGADVGLPSVVSASLTLISVLLFFLAFRGAEGRLRSGELKPTVPPPPTPSWMPAPVAPYAPYWPYAQQVPAPPTTPPAQPPPTPPTP